MRGSGMQAGRNSRGGGTGGREGAEGCAAYFTSPRQGKLQKHQAFEAEVQANSGAIVKLDDHEVHEVLLGLRLMTVRL